MIISSPVTLSGAGVTLTGIPPTTKLLLLSLVNVAKTTTDTIRFRLGTASGLIATGYDSQTFNILPTQSLVTSITDFLIAYTAGAQQIHSGNIMFALADAQNFRWDAFGNLATTAQYNNQMTGRAILNGPLTQLNIFPGSGTFSGGTATYMAAG